MPGSASIHSTPSRSNSFPARHGRQGQHVQHHANPSSTSLTPAHDATPPAALRRTRSESALPPMPVRPRTPSGASSPAISLSPRRSLTVPSLRESEAASIEEVPIETAQALMRASFEVFDAIESPQHASSRHQLARLGERVLDGVRFVTDNRATSAAGQAANSVVNIAARNLASVGATTELRQLMTASFKAGFDKHLPASAQTALALTVIGIPLVLNLVGAWADHHSHTATARSWAGRSMNLALGVAAMALALKAGTTADTAAQCVSTFLYCALRDAIQSSLRLPDESDGMHTGALVATGALYVPNQLAVNRGMTSYGSPSGASAAGRIGERWPKDVVRAGINTAGETVDDVVDMAIHALVQKKPFKVRLETGLPSAQHAMDKLLRMGSARPTVFLSSLMLGHLVDKCLVALPPEQRQGLMSTVTAAVPGADQCLVPPSFLSQAGVSMASDAVFAALIGMLRIPQVLQTGQRPRPDPSDPDTAAA